MAPAAPLLLLLSVAATAVAEPTWRGDFETGATGQWSSLLNQEGISVTEATVLEGRYAGQLDITASHLWPNGLNRVEFQRKPGPELSAEGSEVYFGWSVYLPSALSADDHQIGYWETDRDYQQILSLHARGTDLSLYTQRPGRTVWRGPGLLTAGTWHRIVYYIRWSRDPQAGAVSLWLDGQKHVDCIAAQTFLSNPAFIQLGILRDTIELPERMLVDAALEGRSYADVSLDAAAEEVGCSGDPQPPPVDPAAQAATEDVKASIAAAQQRQRDAEAAEQTEGQSGSCSARRHSAGASSRGALLLGLGISFSSLWRRRRRPHA